MKSSMFHGEYLFHIHTDRTDGQLTVNDYFEFARSRALDSLIFLEHIRREPKYDVAAFVSEVRHVAEVTGVNAHVGFEAKLLPNGSLDISDSHLEIAEVIGIAEHGFPNDLHVLKQAFSAVLKSYPEKFAGKVFVWVHPGLWFKKRGFMHSHLQDYRSMLKEAQQHGVLIEHNLRYGLTDESLLGDFVPDPLVLGADSHSEKDLEKWSDFKRQLVVPEQSLAIAPTPSVTA